MSNHAFFFGKNTTRAQYNFQKVVSYPVNQYPVKSYIIVNGLNDYYDETTTYCPGHTTGYSQFHQ